MRKLEEAVNHLPPADNDSNGSKRKTKTYGMSLSGDSGNVWNVSKACFLVIAQVDKYAPRIHKMEKKIVG